MSDQVVTLRINADGKIAVQVMDQVAASGKRMGAEVREGGREAARGLNEAGDGAKAAGEKVTSAKAAFVALLGAAGIAGGLALTKQLAGAFGSAADRAGQLDSRLKLSTTTHAEFLSVQQRIATVARDAYKSVGDISEVFLRSAGPMRQLGHDTGVVLDLTESLSLALVVNAANTQKSQSTIDAFGKAMQTGTLRGQEFQTIVENAPRFVDALGASLGKTRAELIGLASDGGITIAQLATVGSQLGVLREEAASMPATLEDAATRFGDAWMVWVAGINEATGAVQFIVRITDTLGNNLTIVAAAAGVLGAAHAGAAAKSLLLAIGQRAVAASALAEAEAQMAKQAALVPLIGTTEAYTAAEIRLAAAQQAATAAGVGKAGMLSRLGSGMMALVGGPIGLTVIALGGLATALYASLEAERERSEAFEEGLRQSAADAIALVEEVKALNVELDRVAATRLPPLETSIDTWSRATDTLLEKQTRLLQIERELLTAQADLDLANAYASTGMDTMGLASFDAATRVSRLRAEHESLVPQVAALSGEVDKLTPRMGALLPHLEQTYGALARLSNAGSVAAVMSSLGSALAGFRAQAAQLGADTAYQKSLAQFDTLVEAAAKKVKEAREKTAEWRAELVATTIAQAKARGATDEQVVALRAHLEAGNKTIAQAEALTKRTNDGAKANADYVTGLQRQVATFGMSATAAARYELSTKSLTTSQRAQASAAIAQLEELDRLERKYGTAADALDDLRGMSRSADADIAAMRVQLKGGTEAQQEFNLAQLEAAAAYKLAAEGMDPSALDEYVKAIERARERMDLREAVDKQQEDVRRSQEAQREQLQRTADMWGNVADAVWDSARRSGNFLQNLYRSLRDIVEAMLKEWFRTRVIGTFMGGGGGGGYSGSLMQAGVSYMTGGGGGGGGAMSYVGGGGGGAGSLTSPTTWTNAGRNLYQGWSSAIYGSGQTTWLGSQMGVASYGPGMSTTWTPTGAGAYAGYAAGLYGMYYGATRRGNGGASSAAAGLSYGALGVGAVGAVGGMMGGAGAVAGATGAFASLGAAAWIPVVGWILAIAALVDMFSGGKLFGTKFSTKSATTTLGLSPEGGDASVMLHQERQRSWFGGLARRNKPGEVSPELQRAADEFYANVSRVMSDAARSIAIDTPPMIDAALRTVNEYTKKGKVKSTKYFVDMLGRTWEEETAELAATRIGAEALIATVGASGPGAQASTIAERWRHDAELLAEGAQFLVAATTDIVKGRGLLQDAGSLTDVVDLVEELAHSGEGLAETYQRLSGATALLDQALQLSGVQLDRSREDLVRFAAGIADAAGGLQQAESLWQGYFQSYYDQSEMAMNSLFALQADAARQLSAIGLDPSTSMAGFREAFEEALPTLDPAEVVTWLDAAAALAQMTQATQQVVGSAQEFLASLGLVTPGMSQFTAEIMGIKVAGKQAEEAANAIARAQGRQGASAFQLARISQWTADQIAAAMRALQTQTQDILAELRGGVPGSLDAINARIGVLEQELGGVATGIDAIASSGANLFEAWRAGVQSLRGYLDSMLLGDLSTLSSEDQLAEARRQFEAAQAAALNGDVTALNQLPQLADAYLRMLRSFEASGDDYNTGFDWVRSLLEAVVNAPGPIDAGTGTTPGGGSVEIVPSAELRELYEARDALLAEQEAAHRAALAQQLATNLADMATLLNVPILEMIELQGYSLRELTEDLGINLDELTAGSVQALGSLASTLGLSLTDLTAELGLSLTDLGAGMTELTERIGIDLSALTAESTQSLAALAASLGADLSELATAVGIDLGSLADSQSLLNQALALEINALPADQRDALAPLLAAITDATTEADANTAIMALEDAVNLLAPDIRNLLAPYLEGVMPASALSQLDYLSDLQAIAANQLNVLQRINDNLAAANRALDVPSYAVGTGYVPRDGLAMIHQGEAIIPAPFAAWMRSNGLPTTSAVSSDGAVAGALRDIADRLDRLERTTADGQQQVADAVVRSADRSDQRRDVALDRQADRIAEGRSSRFG